MASRMSMMRSKLCLRSSLPAPVRSKRRTLTTSPRTLQQQPPPPPQSQPTPTPTPGPNRHRLFYRELLPSMIQALALGSVVYIGLNFLQVHLDRKFAVEDLTKEVGRLQEELEVVRERGKGGDVMGGGGGVGSGSGSAGGGEEGRKGWFGLW